MATPRRLLHRALDGLGDGLAALAECAIATVHGEGLPRVRIQVHHPVFCRRVVLGGASGKSCVHSAMPGDTGPPRLPAQGGPR